MPSRPRWSLTQIKQLAADDHLLLTRRGCEYFETGAQAILEVKRLIANLTLGDFSQTAQLAKHLADIYGIKRDGAGWYLKLTVIEADKDETLLVISFHPLEHPLQTRGGKVSP